MDYTEEYIEQQQYRSGYPAPAAPISPVISFDTFSRARQPDRTAHSILDISNILHTTSGRAAITLALEHIRTKPGDEILLPAYHCESMVSPVKYLGAAPKFYRINKDTLLDLNSCRELLSPKTRAIIITHYFGFPQNLGEIRSFCNQHNIVMIEDCAHAFFGKHQGVNIGSAGDYAVASTMKFFPVYDGGLLASNNHDLSGINLFPPPRAFEFKSILTTLERAITYDRLGLAGKLLGLLMQAKDCLWRQLKKIKSRNRHAANTPASADGGFGLDPQWIYIRASKATQFIIKRSNKSRIASQRRKYYNAYVDALANVPGCRPLHPELPKDVVPLIFPVYVENVETIFDNLKKNAVPIWRFGEFLDDAVTRELCPVSYDYSKSVLQFPCHQEMSSSEVEWIIDQIKRACRRTNSSE